MLDSPLDLLAQRTQQETLPIGRVSLDGLKNMAKGLQEAAKASKYTFSKRSTSIKACMKLSLVLDRASISYLSVSRTVYSTKFLLVNRSLCRLDLLFASQSSMDKHHWLSQLSISQRLPDNTPTSSPRLFASSQSLFSHVAPTVRTLVFAHFSFFISVIFISS